MDSNTRKYVGVGLGALVAASATVTLCYQALAQGETAQAGQPRRPGVNRPQAGSPAQPGSEDFAQVPGGGGEGGFGGGGFGGVEGGFGRGGFGGPGPHPGKAMMMGTTSMTANANTVFVLRGNTLLAYDASSLKLKATAELPMPDGHGHGGRGGFGGGGPQRPGNKY